MQNIRQTSFSYDKPLFMDYGRPGFYKKVRVEIFNEQLTMNNFFSGLVKDVV